MTSDTIYLTVDLGERSYPIIIGSGLLSDAALLQKHIGHGQVLVVSNETIAPLYLDTLLDKLGGKNVAVQPDVCLLYTSPSPRD